MLKIAAVIVSLILLVIYDIGVVLGVQLLLRIEYTQEEKEDKVAMWFVRMIIAFAAIIVLASNFIVMLALF